MRTFLEQKNIPLCPGLSTIRSEYTLTSDSTPSMQTTKSGRDKLRCPTAQGVPKYLGKIHKEAIFGQITKKVPTAI